MKAALFSPMRYHGPSNGSGWPVASTTYSSEAAEKAVRAIKEGKVKSIGGKDIAVRADTICVHSDTPNAVDITQAVRAAVKPYLDAA